MIENTLMLGLLLALTVVGIGEIAGDVEGGVYAAATSIEHAAVTGG